MTIASTKNTYSSHLSRQSTIFFVVQVLLGMLALALTPALAAQTTTETLWLSGQGKDEAVLWDFRCSHGRRCGEWTKIPVPSHWELQGFGHYNYGHDEDPSRETGRYRHRFTVPKPWRGRTVDLVFEGVMTDAEVWINGQSAGPKHQGSFYRFHFDISAHLRYGEENELEVLVHKHSSDGSVNRAERDADYWIFGGIYRPVYLESHPSESIAHVAIDARHDGQMLVEVETRGLRSPAKLVFQVEDEDGTSPPQWTDIETTGEPVHLGFSQPDPQPWSAEFPHLYFLRVELQRKGKTLHQRTIPFGFRTFEVRPSGLFVNGQRVILKGVNRHAFWPDSGRTLDRETDFADVDRIKAMNMNAVRMSHYPPDKSFLEACDRLGLYVINELAGWHDAYRTPTGHRLAKQMVRRDVNHPSILFWANGNEGGWNPWIDDVLHKADIQRRPVLRPDMLASGIDTQHYLSWEELEQKLDPEHWRNRWAALFGELPLVMPTELLHGLYDGGSGAGLEDYWEHIRTSPRGAGLFLWSFTDESVVRTDHNGALDSDGNHAPDGVLGPYREISSNFYAVREVLSPIVARSVSIDGATAQVELENRFDRTSLDRCYFRWRAVRWPGPLESEVIVQANGRLAGPPIAPGQAGSLAIPLGDTRADAIELEAFDPHDRLVRTFSLPVERPAKLRERWLAGSGAEGDVTLTQDGGHYRLRAGETVVAFESNQGGHLAFTQGDRTLDLGIAPRPSDLVTPSLRLVEADGQNAIELNYASDSGLANARLELLPSGWLSLSWEQAPQPERPWHGLALPIKRQDVRSVRWLGDGPARIWQNRPQGGRLGVWEKANEDPPPESPAEPKLAGFYDGMHWARLELESGSLNLIFDEGLDLGLFAPEFPEDARDARADVPPEALHVLQSIPPIGTKFMPPEELGPSGWRDEEARTQGRVWLYFDPKAP